MDTQRLEKLFRLLGSDNEHEAAAALRKIKSLIKDAGLTWNQFVGQISFGQKAQPNFRVRPETESSKGFSDWMFQRMREAAEEQKREKERREAEAKKDWERFYRKYGWGPNGERKRDFDFNKFDEDFHGHWEFNGDSNDWIKNTTKENEESLHKETTAEQKEEAWNTFFKRA